jgi:aminoacylase
MADMTEEPLAVQKYREFLRIRTVQPNPDYVSCHAFFEGYAKDLGLEYETIEVRFFMIVIA